MPDEKQMRVIGVSRRRVDARAKVTGQTRYADDIFLPRMAYCKLLRSPHPHARIRKIDTSRAAAHPGVYLVLTGKDVPIEYGILPVSQDEQALCVDHVRHVGDPVAAVIAREELTAFEALDLIDVEYEILTTIADPEEALATPEPRIHDYGEEGNIHKRVSLEFGDVEQGFAEADEIFEDTFFYQGNTHLPIEQHASVAIKDPDGKLTIWSSTQTPHYLHRALAKVLQMAPGHIRVIATPNGGGFGGKSDPFNHEIVVAKAALLLDRPGENLPDARRGVSIATAATSGADEIQNWSEEGRHDHRNAFADADRWRRIRLVRGGKHVLYRRVANNDVSHSALQVSGMPHVHEQAAVRAEARARYGAAALRTGSAARQDCREAEHRSRGFAAAHRGVFECCDGEFLSIERGESFGVHPARREDFGLEGEISQVARRAVAWGWRAPPI